MNRTASRASTRLDPKPGATGTARPIDTASLPEAQGLTQDEIRQIVLDLIG